MARLRPHTILIACTQPRADHIVRLLSEYSIDAIACPALTVSFLNMPRPQGAFDNLLITSHHALGTNLPYLPVIAIGDYTARMVREKGLYVTHTGNGGVQDIDLTGFGNILYPCAMEPRFIPDNVTHWQVYQSYPNTHFAIPDTCQTVCVFSVKAAEIIAPHIMPDHHIICLSAAIADIFLNAGFVNLAVCECPRYDAMEKLILQRDKRP